MIDADESGMRGGRSLRLLLAISAPLMLCVSPAEAQICETFDNATIALADCERIRAEEAWNRWEGAMAECVLRGDRYDLHVFTIHGTLVWQEDCFIFTCEGGQAPLPDGSCVSCTSDAECDDALVCNGMETCDAAGQCQDGTPLDCADSDGLSCTPGICEEPTGCADGPADPSMCMCNDTPLPNVVVTLPSVQIDEISVGCPFIAGRAGASLSVTGSYSHQVPSCHNACTADDRGTLNVSVGVNFCSSGRSPLNIGLMGGIQRQDRGCLVCAEGGCDQTCDGGSCVTQTYSGGATASVSRAIGLSLGPKRIFGSQWRVYCAAQVTGSVSLTGSRAETSGDSECSTCEQCTSVTFGSTLSGAAAATCRVVGGFFGRRVNVGLQDLASIEASFSGNNTGNFGECGDSYCGSTVATIKGAARIPLAPRGTRWWGLRGGRELACSVTWQGCAEQNSCGMCTTCTDCAQQGASFSCGVLPVE